MFDYILLSSVLFVSELRKLQVLLKFHQNRFVQRWNFSRINIEILSAFYREESAKLNKIVSREIRNTAPPPKTRLQIISPDRDDPFKIE